MDVSINKERTKNLLRKLVQINSVNPSLSDEGPGEAETAGFIARVLKEAGIEATLYEVKPGRPNVIGRLRGSGGGRTLILNAHMDVVPVEGMEDPFSARIEDGKLYGRGSVDNKGSIAAGLAAMLALHEAGTPLKGDLVFAGVCDEEYTSAGTEALVKTVTGDGCLVLEKTYLNITVAHGGYAWAEIETRGVSAHGSDPDLGVDAIVKMGNVLCQVGELGNWLKTEKGYTCPLSKETMRPSLHASLIKGGRDLSSYPDRCSLQLERRLIPAESLNMFETEIDGILSRLRDNDAHFDARWDVNFFREPWQANDDQLLDALESACSKELPIKPRLTTMMGWTDAALMQAAGIPSLIFGPCGKGSHSNQEYVDIESVITCAKILSRMAANFCNLDH